MPILYTAYCRLYQGALRSAARFLDWSEPRLISGSAALPELAAALRGAGALRVLVVSDPILNKLGLTQRLLSALSGAGIGYSLYAEVQPNPTIANIESARALYLRDGCTAIAAIGGGSVIDCAKAAGARIAVPGKPIPAMRGQLRIRKRLPLLAAIPTTAGTGSETTLAAVILDPGTHEKYALNDPVLRPKIAVLDPGLTTGLPPAITAATGLDALTHAVEAYIGRSNTPDTKRNAIAAVRAVFAYLPRAYTCGTDLQAREKMLQASYQAGLAFTRAYVGYCHAIAHALGGLYGIPHGLANAVILPAILESYGPCAYPPLAELAEAIGIRDGSREEKAKRFIGRLRDMESALRIPAGFPEIRAEDIPLLARRAAKEGNPLYPVPRVMGFKELAAVIRGLMA